MTLPCAAAAACGNDALSEHCIIGSEPSVCHYVHARKMMTLVSELNVGLQVWSIVVGLPLCAVGGVFYSWASGQTLVDGFVNAYGALYKIPGGHAFLHCCNFRAFSVGLMV